MPGAKILIVDDQQAIREELAYALRYEEHEPIEAENGKAALAVIAEQGAELAAVLLDIKMPGMDGLEVLTQIAAEHPTLPVIMITAHGDIDTAVLAVKKGAFDFMTKPLDTDRVMVSLRNALRSRDLESENQALRRDLAVETRLRGDSEAMQAVRKTIERAAPTEATVLITGENGTGKELVAQQVHALSKRSRGPFVAVNCAAIPQDLVESELFGHERGSFTGANSRRKGHFEMASGGTIFLDEIGEMPVEMQAKLLRTLQENVVTRLGSSEPIPVDARVVAATNQDLEERMAEGAFREDLYYRLMVIRIPMPPLRDRPDDIPGLAGWFLQQAARRNGLSDKPLTSEAIAWLQTRQWPGNVRQLKNMLEGAVILAEGDTLDRDDLESSAVPSAPRDGDPDWFAIETIEEFRATIEREFVRRKLQENDGNIKRTAERIRIQRSNLYKKLDKYGLK